MNHRLIAGSLLALAIPASSVAQTGFDGMWKVDFQSAMPTKVNIWLLKNGRFSCTSYSPTVEVKADGKDQPVSGQPYDIISVQIVDSQTVREIEKKNGQIVSDEKLVVSADGTTATDEFGNWKCAGSNSGGWSRDRAQVTDLGAAPCGFQGAGLESTSSLSGAGTISYRGWRSRSNHRGFLDKRGGGLPFAMFKEWAVLLLFESLSAVSCSL